LPHHKPATSNSEEREYSESQNDIPQKVIWLAKVEWRWCLWALYQRVGYRDVNMIWKKPITLPGLHCVFEMSLIWPIHFLGGKKL